MKSLVHRACWTVALIACAWTLPGCGHKATAPKVMAQLLENSFSNADSTVKQNVSQASAAVQNGNFPQAIITMNQLTQRQPLDQAQKQAMSLLIQQTRQAVNENPKLNSPELYKAMSDLVLRVHGEN